MHWVMLGLLNLGNRGDAGAGAAGAGDSKTFTQEQLDNVVKERLAREREKFSDYGDLKKFRDEHQQAADAQVQKQLEEQKEYQRAKDNYEKKIQELSGTVTQKDSHIKDMTISNALVNELIKQGAYVEEAIALLKGNALVTDTGEIRIKSKDANGVDTQLTIADGVKGFLTSRPHLIKATNRGGGGSDGGAGGAGGGAGGAPDLMKLNEDYIKARASGDYKRAGELKGEINKALTSKGANRNAM